MKPCQRHFDRCDHRAVGQGGPVDQNDRQPPLSGGDQLGFGPRAPGILGHDNVDAVLGQQRKIICDQKRSARDKCRGVWQGQGFGRGIDKPQQVMVLRLIGEIRDMLPPYGQKHPLRRASQQRSRRRNIRDVAPVIARTSLPGGTLQRGQRRACGRTGGKDIAADLGGKGMGGVDHTANSAVLKILCQPFGPAKPPRSHRNGLGARTFDPARIGQDRGQPGLGHCGGKLAGLGGSAKNKGGAHG